jgi:GGDEF domain-containing protein/CHASE3 domain sensor protein
VQPASVPLRKLPPATSQLLDRLGKPPAFFRRLKISDKMLLGYAVLAVLCLVVGVYALYNLQRINDLNTTIVKVDVVIQESSARMMDALLAMDAYEKRFLLLGTDDMASLFQKRKREFDASFLVMAALPRRDGRALEQIEQMGQAYAGLFSEEIELVKAGRLRQARAISDGQLKEVGDRLTAALRALNAEARQAEESRMEKVGAVGRRAFLTTIALCCSGMLLGAVASLVVTHFVSSSIARLTEATDHYAEGDFAFDPQITTGDEIGVLSQAFLAMGRRLAKLEEMSLDASPLTRLPGGVAIEREVQKRIDSGLPLAFCWIDLSNFKAFNDRYGYARGNEVIKRTAAIMESAVQALGTAGDFLGHMGGDDFAVLTAPAVKEELAREIIARFDRQIPDFYDPPDRERGYILGRTRQGVEVRFPLMTMAIAIVTNEHRKLSSFPQVTAIAAELKEKAKIRSRSTFLLDRRRGP